MELEHLMGTKERYANIQTILGNCHTGGCLFLCLCSIAEEQTGKSIDLIDCIKTSLAKGWITSEFWVNDSLAILHYLTGKIWTRRTVSKLPSIMDTAEYSIMIYYNKRTNFHHYKRRGYDTLSSSVTVREGIVEGYYIYSWRHS